MAALSASMLLAGCDNVGNKQTTSLDSETALKTFVQNVAPNNLTMTLNASSGKNSFDYTYYYLGADAFMMTDGTDNNQGILVNNDQGFFLFTVKDNKVNLQGCQGLGNDITTYFTTPSGVFADSTFYSYIDVDDVTAESNTYSYDLNTKQMIRDLTSYMSKGTGSTCLYFLLSLVGSSGSYYKYVSSANLTIASDASYADVKVKLSSGKGVFTYTCHLSDFGKTDVKAVSDYLANAEDIAAPTAWDEDCSNSIKSVFAGKESDVIFPKGIVGASFDQQALVYTNKSEDDEDSSSSSSSETSFTYAGVQWSFYGKDLKTSYGDMLEKAGYEYVGSQVSKSDKYTHYYYQKEYAAQTKDEGAVYIQCDFYYYSGTKEFTCQIYLAQDALRYENLSLTDANAKIAEINATAEYDIPVLAESESIKTIDVADYTSISAQSYNVSYYYVIDITFEKEDEAKAYAKAYIASISTNYADTGTYTWEDDGAVEYAVTSGSNYLAILEIVEGKASDGTYLVEIRALGA